MRFLKEFITLFISYYSILSVGVACDSFSESAKYDCLKAGDALATLGDFESAKKNWKISCEKGSQLACSSVKEIETDFKSFKKRWESDPANKMAILNAKAEKCKFASENDKACVDEAKKQLADGHISLAIDILDRMCSRNDSLACFELGGTYVRNNDLDKSVQPYMTACSLGHANSCTILQQVQSNLQLTVQNGIRKDAEQREVAAEKRKRREEEDKRIKEIFTPKRMDCSSHSFGGSVETTCREY